MLIMNTGITKPWNKTDSATTALENTVIEEQSILDSLANVYNAALKGVKDYESITW